MKIGEWNYNNRRVAQAAGVPELLNEVGEELKLKGELPTSIIEIGTYYGGFTEMLRDSVLSENCKEIITFEILDRANLAESFKNTGINFNLLDALSASGRNIIQKEIDREGKTIVFCDGGNKVNEFHYVSNMLKVGDIILAHDYAYDSNTFNTKLRDTVWNWFEIEYGKIQGACEANSLEKCEFTSRFEGKAWACFQKTK